MYGKIFDSIYDGTLSEDWRALITFQQMIVLCDADGVLDMTPNAISRRTGIPIEHIKAGIEILEHTDPYSRTKDEDGRRIRRLEDDRPWGWYIVNHKKYKNLQDSDTIRAQNRERKRRQREREIDVTDSHAMSRSVTDSHAPSLHTDTNTDTDTRTTTLSGKPDPSPPKNNFKRQAQEILTFLNTKANRAFQPVPANVDLIVNRLKEGATPGQCRQVIARKIMDWATDDDMSTYLRPKTIFNRTNFAQYVGELVVENE